ncbi:DJ-1/PfpI family protein [Dictyobacter aurantiacus]|uniref:AraC family transcriptional regulator n=1 Tax=Dictyobacter aurantiacus TaxID=1936993 RepID=A0A401ZR31_9CHLR|nr:DJ-1/PfpI family protein [Dictyobacter aurantiacus]GCE09323.1 AraC family transcriptional regulator [Dictyobacter aurantiacus]
MKQQWTVGILLFDHVDLTDVAGPYEVFHSAGYTISDLQKGLLGQDTSENHPFVVRTVSQAGIPLQASNGLRLQPDYSFEQAPAFDIVVVPGANLGVIAHVIAQDEVMRWIARASSQSQLMTSVCTGAFFLAQAGLLNGKRATTHWAALDLFEQQFSQIQVQRTGKFVDEGTIITSAGVTSGFNMALHVVERLLGEQMAQAIAKGIDFQTSLARG